MASKLYGVNAAVIIFVFVLYCIRFHRNREEVEKMEIHFILKKKLIFFSRFQLKRFLEH